MSFFIGRTIGNVKRSVIAAVSDFGFLLTSDAPIKPTGTHTTVSNLASVVTLTPPAGARCVLIQAFAGNVRYTLDGTSTPSATSGFVLQSDSDPVLIPIVNAIKLIQEGAGASVQYQWGV